MVIGLIRRFFQARRARRRGSNLQQPNSGPQAQKQNDSKKPTKPKNDSKLPFNRPSPKKGAAEKSPQAKTDTKEDKTSKLSGGKRKSFFEKAVSEHGTKYQEGKMSPEQMKNAVGVNFDLHAVYLLGKNEIHTRAGASNEIKQHEAAHALDLQSDGKFDGIVGADQGFSKEVDRALAKLDSQAYKAGGEDFSYIARYKGHKYYKAEGMAVLYQKFAKNPEMFKREFPGLAKEFMEAEAKQ